MWKYIAKYHSKVFFNQAKQAMLSRCLVGNSQWKIVLDCCGFPDCPRPFDFSYHTFIPNSGIPAHRHKYRSLNYCWILISQAELSSYCFTMGFVLGWCFWRGFLFFFFFLKFGYFPPCLVFLRVLQSHWKGFQWIARVSGQVLWSFFN